MSSAAFCTVRTMCTWKHRSYLPTSWVILQNRCENGHLHMRGSVLFWNQQISQRATILSQYLQGLLSGAAFRNSLHGALPPIVGQSFLWAGSSPAGIEGPASAAICTSCLVGDDPSNCPTSSSLLPLPLYFAQGRGPPVVPRPVPWSWPGIFTLLWGSLLS